MLELLVVAVGGGVGAGARFMVDGEIRTRHNGGFPWGTFTVNAVGSFLIGVFSALISTFSQVGMLPIDQVRPLQLALMVGLCGGFTTFSTSTMESVRLAQSGRLRLALANTLGTLTVTIVAAALGVAVGKLFG